MDSTKKVIRPLGSGTLTLALCGDVMTGRGIDQILAHPSNPTLHESYMRQAQGYVELAELKSGPIPRGVDPAYIWGDALQDLEMKNPDACIINLETAVTVSDHWEDKGINYRMNPKNIDCLTIARVDCCTLANNHVLDWGKKGLLETLESLHGAGVAYAGAGRDQREAEAPAILKLGTRGRVLVIGLGSPTSGIPSAWAADPSHPGVNLVDVLSIFGVEKVRQQVQRIKQANDVVVASIHWGENWGYEIPASQVEFAHALIDHAGVDLVHGHSSHHVKAFELYRGKLILYGCGDFINDYEGIGGYESFRGDLSVLYFVKLSAETGRLLSLEMRPYVMKRFSLQKASIKDVSWLRDLLMQEKEICSLGLQIEETKTGFSLSL